MSRHSGPHPKSARIKLQVVEHHDLSFDPDGDGTIGSAIDEMIQESMRRGRYPNKISVDVDPPGEESLNQI